MAITVIESTDPSAEIRATYASYLRNALERSPHTVESYDRVLRKVAEHLPHGDLLAATDAELRQVFVMSAWTQALTSKTKRTNLTVVASFYDWLADDTGLITQAPTRGLRRLTKRLSSATQKLPTYLTMPEVDRLMEALGAKDGVPRLNGVRDQAIAGVMALAGGRQTETIGGLQVSDVDLRSGNICFRTLTKRGKQRIVPVSPRLRGLLAAWLRVREDAPSQALFLSNRGTPFNDPTAWTDTVLDPAARRAGLQWVVCSRHGRDGCTPGQRGTPGGCNQAGWRVHPHTLRHSFAVECLRSGACNIAELRDLLGHANIATTNIYLALVQDPGSDERFRRRFGRHPR